MSVISHSKRRQKPHHRQYGKDRIGNPSLPLRILIKLGSKEQQSQQARIEGDQVADQMQGLMNKDPVPDESNAGKRLEQNNSLRGNARPELAVKCEGKAEIQNSKYDEICLLKGILPE